MSGRKRYPAILAQVHHTFHTNAQVLNRTIIDHLNEVRRGGPDRGEFFGYFENESHDYAAYGFQETVDSDGDANWNILIRDVRFAQSIITYIKTKAE